MNLSSWCKSNNIHTAHNVIHATAVWTLWKTGNDLCFNHWYAGRAVKFGAYPCAMQALSSGPAREQVSVTVARLEGLEREPPLILWLDPESPTTLWRSTWCSEEKSWPLPYFGVSLFLFQIRDVEGTLLPFPLYISHIFVVCLTWKQINAYTRSKSVSR